MVKKIKPDGSKTIYVGGVYEVDKTSGGTVTRTVTYYPAGGAMRINIVGGSNSLYYILKDHLGSASVVTDASGVTVGDQRYYPYGESRLTATMYTDKLFTGQRDTGLGIYDYGARMYDPKLGRFLSPDSIIPSYTNPQDLNRFSYVTNNPLPYTDPTGHMQKCDDGDEGGGCGLGTHGDNIRIAINQIEKRGGGPKHGVHLGTYLAALENGVIADAEYQLHPTSIEAEENKIQTAKEARLQKLLAIGLPPADYPDRMLEYPKIIGGGKVGDDGLWSGGRMANLVVEDLLLIPVCFFQTH